MLVSILCSGSEGNSVLVKTDKHKLLIDCGLNNKYIKDNLEEVGVNESDIDSIFITHSHSDHIGALKVFLNKNHPRVYIDEKMFEDSAMDFLRVYDNLEFSKGPFELDDISVEIYKTSHDAPGSRGYIISNNNKSVVYCTDTGYINHKLFDKLSNKTLYIFESNHDIEMLMHGRYPSWLKKRVSSDTGHLSNHQAGFYLSKIIGEDTKQVVLAHISKENNTPEIALEDVLSELKENDCKFSNLICAKQRERLDIEI